MAVTLVTTVPAIFEIFNGVFETFVGLHFVDQEIRVQISK